MKFKRLLHISNFMRNLFSLLCVFLFCRSYTFRNTGLSNADLLTSKRMHSTGFWWHMQLQCLLCLQKNLASAVPNPWPGFRCVLCSLLGVITKAFKVQIVNACVFSWGNVKKTKPPLPVMKTFWVKTKIKNVAASLIFCSFYSNFILHFWRAISKLTQVIGKKTS